MADLLESIFQNPSTFRLYNVDVSPEQQYFLEKDLFPLAHVGVYSSGEEITKWRVFDSVEDTDYETPRLKVMGLGVSLGDKVPRMDSRLTSISLTPSIYHDDDEADPIEIQADDEGKILVETVKEVQRFDPDFHHRQRGRVSSSRIFTQRLRSIRFPSTSTGIQTRKKLHTAPSPEEGPTSADGRIMYRPMTQRFFGRIHVDGQNTFVNDQYRFEGLFEIARISRMPFHTSSRAFIGKALLAQQDDGTVICVLVLYQDESGPGGI